MQAAATRCQPAESTDVWSGAAGSIIPPLQITMKAARVNADLTQNEAASRIGVDRTTIVKWESGKTIPSVPKLKMMAEVYGISVDNIFLPL